VEISFLLTGLIAGILAGLFGVGGGLVIVPALYFILPYYSVAQENIMHIALATSLATIIITSISSAYSHYKHKAILVAVFLKLSPGLFIGALLIGLVANNFRSEWLTIFFIIFEFLIAAQMLRASQINANRQLPSALGLGVSGTGIGVISALAGIGGGSLTVPFLSWCKVPIKNAIATSAACGFPIAIGGMLGFTISGWDVVALPENSLGYVYLPAFLYISMASVICAPLGAILAHRLKSSLLKKLFALMLIVIAIRMMARLI